MPWLAVRAAGSWANRSCSSPPPPRCRRRLPPTCRRSTRAAGCSTEGPVLSTTARSPPWKPPDPVGTLGHVACQGGTQVAPVSPLVGDRAGVHVRRLLFRRHPSISVTAGDHETDPGRAEVWAGADLERRCDLPERCGGGGWWG